jgi:hypothetical protein
MSLKGETPSLGSVHNLTHWLQAAHTHRFCTYNPLHDPARRDQVQDYDLSTISTPVALFGGSEDKLIDINLVAEKLKPSVVVYKRVQDDYYVSDTPQCAQ